MDAAAVCVFIAGEMVVGNAVVAPAVPSETMGKFIRKPFAGWLATVPIYSPTFFVMYASLSPGRPQNYVRRTVT